MRKNKHYGCMICQYGDMEKATYHKNGEGKKVTRVFCNLKKIHVFAESANRCTKDKRAVINSRQVKTSLPLWVDEENYTLTVDEWLIFQDKYAVDAGYL